MFEGASHAHGGIKFRAGGRVHEAEGGEAIINRKSTKMFKPLLSKINSLGGGKRFQSGGVVNDIASVQSQIDQTTQIENSIKNLPSPVVRVTEINEVQTNVAQTVEVSQL